MLLKARCRSHYYKNSYAFPCNILFWVVICHYRVCCRAVKLWVFHFVSVLWMFRRFYTRQRMNHNNLNVHRAHCVLVGWQTCSSAQYPRHLPPGPQCATVGCMPIKLRMLSRNVCGWFIGESSNKSWCLSPHTVTSCMYPSGPHVIWIRMSASVTTEWKYRSSKVILYLKGNATSCKGFFLFLNISFKTMQFIGVYLSSYSQSSSEFANFQIAVNKYSIFD